MGTRHWSWMTALVSLLWGAVISYEIHDFTRIMIHHSSHLAVFGAGAWLAIVIAFGIVMVARIVATVVIGRAIIKITEELEKI